MSLAVGNSPGRIITQAEVGDVVTHKDLDALAERQNPNGALWTAPTGDGTSLWIVTAAMKTGGQYVSFGRKEEGGASTPEIFQVAATRLNPDGSYNPDGIKISFQQSTQSEGNYIEAVRKVGHRRMTFVAD
jgi:hypothetical protein